MLNFSSDELLKIRMDVIERFVRYVKVHTTSSETSESFPSTATQFDLANLVAEELRQIGLTEIEVDKNCYVYGVLPATVAVSGIPLSFCAHLDTSPSVSGENVLPVFHEKYNGANLTFPRNPELLLTPEECPELKHFIGDTIITSAGDTLLGADDKAGIAEIIAGLDYLVAHPEIAHPEIRICITPDEELGQGTRYIHMEKLGKVCYTFDGGLMGELESECFDAWYASVKFKGHNVHPGEAKNKMINAGAIAGRFLSMLPEWETPEHTELKEGYIHLTHIEGDESSAELQFIIRDFVNEKNRKRIEMLEQLKTFLLAKYPGLQIDIQTREQYRNMLEVLKNYPLVTEVAQFAIEGSDIPVIHKAIRGGTDGARLSFMGIPTPNIFTGGLLFHSNKEWIPVSAMVKAVEVMVRISNEWANRSL